MLFTLQHNVQDPQRFGDTELPCLIGVSERRMFISKWRLHRSFCSALRLSSVPRHSSALPDLTEDRLVVLGIKHLYAATSSADVQSGTLATLSMSTWIGNQINTAQLSLASRAGDKRGW
jgi:hypothetical protein